MAQFPRFINPPTPGGIQAFWLEQKLLNIDALTKAIASGTEVKQKTGGVGGKQKEADILKGRIGAVNQYYQNVNSALADISLLEQIYGELATEMPEYKRAQNSLDYYTGAEFQNIVDRETKEFDQYSQLVKENKAGHLFHLGEFVKSQGKSTVRNTELLKQQEQGITSALPNVYNDKQLTAEGLGYGYQYNRELDLNPNFYNRTDARNELDAIFNPANQQFDEAGNVWASIAPKIVQGASFAIEGIETSKGSTSDDIKALSFATEEAQNRFAGTLDITDPLVSGYLQAFLQDSNDGQKYGGKNLRDKDGTVNENFYTEFQAFVESDIKDHFQKRITKNEDLTKSFQEQSDFAYNAGVANKELVEVLEGGFTEPETTVVSGVEGSYGISQASADKIIKLYTDAGLPNPLAGAENNENALTMNVAADGTVKYDLNPKFQADMAKLIQQRNLIRAKYKPGTPEYEKETKNINELQKMYVSTSAEADALTVKNVHNFEDYNVRLYPLNTNITTQMNKNFENKDPDKFLNGIPISISNGSFHDSKLLGGTKFETVHGDMKQAIRPQATNWMYKEGQGWNFFGINNQPIDAAGYYADDKTGYLLKPHNKESLEAVNAHVAANSEHKNVGGMSQSTYWQQAQFAVPQEREAEWFERLKKAEVMTNFKSAYTSDVFKKNAAKVQKALAAASQALPIGGGVVVQGTQRGQSDLDALSDAAFQKKYGMTKDETNTIISTVGGTEGSLAEKTEAYLDNLSIKQGHQVKSKKQYAVTEPLITDPTMTVEEFKARVAENNLKGVMPMESAKKMMPFVEVEEKKNSDGEIISTKKTLKFTAEIDVSKLIYNEGSVNDSTRKYYKDNQLNYSNEIVEKALGKKQPVQPQGQGAKEAQKYFVK